MSGEALASSASDETIDAAVVERLAGEIAETRAELDLELAVMVGGGNIWRGTTGAGQGMDRATSDTMGMLATVINALALQDAIEHHGQPTRVLSAVQMAEVAEPYIRRRAIRHLEKGRVVIFAAGMGNPYFTTDTSAALRAAEIEAEMLLKGTHAGVDGVYSADPRLDPTATRYDESRFMDVVDKDLRVMDLTAITFCKDNGLPVLVFDLMGPGNLRKCARRRGDRYADPVKRWSSWVIGRRWLRWPLMDDDLIARGSDARDHMERRSSHTQAEFGGVRTGRATSGLVEHLRVDVLRRRGRAAPDRRAQRARGPAAGDLPLRQVYPGRPSRRRSRPRTWVSPRPTTGR